MNKWESMGRQILGQKGSEEKLRALSQSREMQSVSKQVEAEAVQRAMADGDTEALRRILSQVLSTEDGQRLAKQIGSMMGK